MLEKGINSYLSVDEANDIIKDIDTSDLWQSLSVNEQEQRLILATLHIDSLMLSSRKHSAEQVLQSIS